MLDALFQVMEEDVKATNEILSSCFLGHLISVEDHSEKVQARARLWNNVELNLLFIALTGREGIALVGARKSVCRDTNPCCI